jgi:hypothetical protein
MLYRKMFLKMVAAACLLPGIASVMAQEGIQPNGHYSSVGVALFRTNYANEKCILGECHQGYGGLGINLAYQPIPNMIIGLRTMGGQSSGPNTTIKESQGGVYIGFVMGVGEYWDIGGIISPVSKRYESCLGNLCGTSEDTGTNAEFFAKWWLNDEKTFNLGLNINSYTYANGNTNPNAATKYSSSALSVAYLMDGHHELSLSGTRLRDSALATEVSTTSSLAYTYRF